MTEKHFPVLPGVIFGDDSPFRRLPANLDPTQRRFFEGIRFAAEMAQLSHIRVRRTLTAVSLGTYPDGATHSDLTVAAVLDAWSIIDSLHRLRELLGATPRLKKRGAVLELFLRGTESVLALRNRVQHLKGDLLAQDLSHLPVWGTVGWLWVLNKDLTHFTSGSMSAGADPGYVNHLLTPAGRAFHDQLDHITLSVGALELDISEAMRLTVRVMRALEASFAPQIADQQPHPLQDAILLATIEMPREAGEIGAVPPAI